MRCGVLEQNRRETHPTSPINLTLTLEFPIALSNRSEVANSTIVSPSKPGKLDDILFSTHTPL
jgi:hypothetical protein